MNVEFLKWIIEIIIIGVACAFGGYGLGFKQALKNSTRKSSKSNSSKSTIKNKSMED